ncbi:MAG: hypothetical protein QXD45_05155 [Candidatus Bathyarchaeia archaeon]
MKSLRTLSHYKILKDLALQVPSINRLRAIAISVFSALGLDGEGITLEVYTVLVNPTAINDVAWQFLCIRCSLCIF